MPVPRRLDDDRRTFLSGCAYLFTVYGHGAESHAADSASAAPTPSPTHPRNRGRDRWHDLILVARTSCALHRLRLFRYLPVLPHQIRAEVSRRCLCALSTPRY